MANDFDSNFTRKLARVFLEKFDSNRVLSKNVDTQLLEGKFDPSTGDTVDFKRPTDYVSTRTSDGDITGTTASSIITGKASGVVQDYFTVEVDFKEADQAIKMDQLDKLLAPMATRIKTDFEVDFARFMMENSGLRAGTVGEGAKTWDEVAEAGALMQSVGVPMDDGWCYAVNPYTQRSLASDQRSLGSVDPLISEAHRKAIISNDFAGMKVMTATTLASYTTGVGATRSGTLSATPTATYLAAKDTMTQSLAVTGFTSGLVVAAGETVTVAAAGGAIELLNLSTRQPILDENGAPVLWTGVVTQAVTLTGGAGTLIVSGPAINEVAGQYNTVSNAMVSGDAITLGASAASTIIQPNLFWHKQAFSVGSVPIDKLYSTDTIATTEDGLQIRVSKGTSFRENKQMVRFDFRPAYGVMNPFFAGQGFGVA